MKLYPTAVNLLGERFGSLEVTALAGSARRGNIWLCKCSCGNETYKAFAGDLRSGRVNSCGCFKKSEAYAAINRTHGQRNSNNGKPTRAYSAWFEMKRRCNDSSRENFKYYGGKGIDYPLQWQEFEGFYADMGDCPPGHELDRKDAKKNYSKDNCRWLSKLDNIKNRDGKLE